MRLRRKPYAIEPHLSILSALRPRYAGRNALRRFAAPDGRTDGTRRAEKIMLTSSQLTVSRKEEDEVIVIEQIERWR